MAYGTATIERQNGNGQHGMPIALLRADEVEALRREVETLRRERDAIWRTHVDMRRVLTQTGWNPAQRIQYAMLQARIPNAPGDGPAAVLEGGARQWSRQLGRGFGEQTVAANLAALQRAGLLKREERKQKMPDGTVKTVYTGIHVWRALPAELPATLEDGPRREKARTTADKQRALYKALAGMTCPECGTVGEFAITCTACGTALQDEARETLPASDAEAGRDAVLDEAVAGGDSINDGPGSAPDDPWADVWPTVADDGRETLPPISRGADFLPPREADGGRETAGEAAGIIEIRNGEETLPAIEPAHFTGPTMTGAVTLNYLARDGAAFTFAPAQSKKAMGEAWPDKPHGLRDALAHLNRGGNVGILSGEGQLALIDLDEHAGDFLRAHPALAAAPLVFRRDAPERVKVIIRLEGEAGEHFAAGKDARRKAEYLASRHHGIIAGTHASGATIEVRPGVLPTMTGEAARAICVAWADAPPPIIEPPARRPANTSPATPATASSATGSGAMSAAERDALRDEAIAWANADAGIRGEVDAWLAKRKREGKYYSIRPDDRTPSATWGDCDGQRRIMRDYGRVSKADAAMDDFELWTRITHNGDKGAAIRAAIRLYCAATGKPSPAWAEVKR